VEPGPESSPQPDVAAVEPLEADLAEIAVESEIAGSEIAGFDGIEVTDAPDASDRNAAFVTSTPAEVFEPAAADSDALAGANLDAIELDSSETGGIEPQYLEVDSNALTDTSAPAPLDVAEPSLESATPALEQSEAGSLDVAAQAGIQALGFLDPAATPIAADEQLLEQDPAEQRAPDVEFTATLEHELAGSSLKPEPLVEASAPGIEAAIEAGADVVALELETPQQAPSLEQQVVPLAQPPAAVTSVPLLSEQHSSNTSAEPRDLAPPAVAALSAPSDSMPHPEQLRRGSITALMDEYPAAPTPTGQRGGSVESVYEVDVAAFIGPLASFEHDTLRDDTD
jgi:hypothetical protein